MTLSADPERTVTIPITKDNQGGASASDYSGVPASVTFNNGETERTFTFTAKEDLLNDSGESVDLGFGTLPSGVSAGDTDETTISILHVAPQTSLIVSFDAPDYTVNEGNSVVVTVSLNQAPGSDVEIPLTVANQGGASTADYSGVPASLAFGGTDTAKTFTFTATQDTADDDGESVKLGFGTLPSGVSEGATGETTVSINDDDVPSVTVSFEQGTYTVAEGSSATVTVTLSADPERTITIPLTKNNQGGASTADYSGVPAGVTFNSGDTEKTFDFQAAQDTVDDDDESVRLTFGTLPTGVSEGSANETVITITDDDTTVQPQVSVQVSFEAPSYILMEGNTTEITVVLNADPERTVTIPITMTDGTGTTSSDYSGVPQEITFNSGDTEKSFPFSATQDSADEDQEVVTLGFGTLPEYTTAGSPDQAVVTIGDSIHVSFSASSYEAYEGGAGAIVTVNLDGPAAPGTVVPITADGMNGATSDDWRGVPVNLTFEGERPRRASR